MDNLVKSELQIENMIYEIRGKQVMLDSDLAKLYQCKNGTKTINLAVKRNIERFPERFMFRLTLDECRLIPRFQIETLVNGHNIKYLPYVFTEQGVAMLATVIRTEVAVKTSIKVMDAFVAMRKYLSNNLIEQQLLEKQVISNTKRIEKAETELALLQESFKKFEERKVVNEIYFNGQIYDAYSKILDIFNEAQKEIVIIDGYADKSILDIARNIKADIKLITFTKNTKFQSLYSKYSKQYSNLKVTYNNSFHDRYFILDQSTVYHCGASINYAGSKTFSINKIEDRVVIDALIKTINKIV